VGRRGESRKEKNGTKKREKEKEEKEGQDRTGASVQIYLGGEILSAGKWVPVPEARKSRLEADRGARGSGGRGSNEPLPSGRGPGEQCKFPS